MSNDPASLRDGEAGDLAFVYSTWLRELRHADHGPLSDDLWFPAHREHINRVLSDPAVKLLVLHPTDARREILGYVVAQPESGDDPGILHWIYIKPRYREKFGLCRRLLEASRTLNAPMTWTTPSARQKLRNLRRARVLRPKYADRRGA